MPTDEFSRKVRNDTTNISVAQAGAVDVTSDGTRDLGKVDVANQPLGIDDTNPISVSQSQPDVSQEVIIASGSVASGGSVKGSLSPPAGEVWEVIAFTQHFDITSGTTGNGTSRIIVRDGGDFTPAIISHQSITKFGHEGWVGVGTQDAFRDGSGTPILPGNATSLLVSDDGDASVWVPSTMELWTKFANGTDASAGAVRATALVRKYKV